MKIRVLHAYYGCETGCCGHILEVDGEEARGSFTFTHFDEVEPATVLDQIVDAIDETYRPISARVKAYILRHVPKDCHDSIDWTSIEVQSGGDYC